MNRDRALLVLTNLPDEASAQSLARALVAHRLAACVNILPAIRSVYRWQGTIEEAAETTLLIKTTQACYPALQQAIQDGHPYTLPEIVALSIADGLPAYLDWLTQETNSDADG